MNTGDDDDTIACFAAERLPQLAPDLSAGKVLSYKNSGCILLVQSSRWPPESLIRPRSTTCRSAEITGTDTHLVTSTALEHNGFQCVNVRPSWFTGTCIDFSWAPVVHCATALVGNLIAATTFRADPSPVAAQLTPGNRHVVGDSTSFAEHLHRCPQPPSRTDAIGRSGGCPPPVVGHVSPTLRVRRWTALEAFSIPAVENSWNRGPRADLCSGSRWQCCTTNRTTGRPAFYWVNYP